MTAFSPDPETRLSRRALGHAALVLWPIAYGAAFLAGALRYLSPLPPPRRKPRLEVGPAADFAAGKVERVEFNGKSIFVLGGQEGIVALDATCTHFSCNVNWAAGEKCFVCPCHGARFDRSGKVIRKPAVEPLRRQKFTEEGGRVVLLDDAGAAGPTGAAG